VTTKGDLSSSMFAASVPSFEGRLRGILDCAGTISSTLLGKIWAGCPLLKSSSKNDVNAIFRRVRVGILRFASDVGEVVRGRNGDNSQKRGARKQRYPRKAINV